jgi:hypothetical protein
MAGGSRRERELAEDLTERVQCHREVALHRTDAQTEADMRAILRRGADARAAE